MKKVIILFITLMLVLNTHSQAKKPYQKFDPQRFQADLEQYITKEAGLTPKEAAAFFPVYREMMNKQRALYTKNSRFRFVNPTDEAGFRKAIQERDEMELKVKELQKKYHEKFLSILSAKKVHQIIMAEDKFHRHSFQRFAGKKSQSK